MRVVLRGSLGDVVVVTAAIREYRRYRPAERVHLETNRPELFVGNPRLEGTQEEDQQTVRLPLGGGYPLGHMAHAYGQAMGIRVVDTTPEIFLSAAEQAVAAEIPLGERTLAIDTWAGWPSRRVSHAFWEAVATGAQQAGWGVVEVGAHHRDCTGAVRWAALPGVDSLVNKLSVRETAAVLARVTVYAGCDSGLAHLAAAVHTPQIILYGPQPWWTRAYRSTIPLFPAACACLAKERCQAAQHCLDEITPDDVLRALHAHA